MRPFAAITLCICICLPAGCKRRPTGGSKTNRGSRAADGTELPGGSYDPSLAGAEETANKFGKAWKKQDFDAAKELFSRLRSVGEGRASFELHTEVFLQGDISSRRQKGNWRVMLVRYNRKWLVDEIHFE
ncbi:MAG: hypothetical protein ACYTF6_12960 [Planctomycetota bacterium]|jgi:hypothetical protein